MQLCKGRVPRRRWELGFLVCCRSRSYCSWCCCWRELATSKHSCWHLAMTSVLLRRSTEKQRCAVSFILLWLLMPRDWNWSMYSFVYLVDEHIREYVVQHEFATSWPVVLDERYCVVFVLCLTRTHPSNVWMCCFDDYLFELCNGVYMKLFRDNWIDCRSYLDVELQYMCPFCLGKLNLTCWSCSVCYEYTLPFVLW